MNDNDSVMECDSNGNLTYYKYPSGCEKWCEYDSDGRLIHLKYSDGYEYWIKYCSNGYGVHYRNSNGIEHWYDEKEKHTEDPVKILLLAQKLYSEALR